MDLPIRKTMCATCPFNPGSMYSYLASDLAASALSDTSRICHSTGKNNSINRRTGKLPHICRGARDLQLHAMHAGGILTEPSDDAWNEARVELLGMTPQEIKDP